MGRALAICHWRLQNDANDVEFVLGCVKPGEVPRLWMFDFDKVRGIEWDEEGMVQAVESVVRNDPYFPRAPPELGEWEVEGYTKADEMLWLSFRNPHLLMAKVLAGWEGNEGDAAVICRMSERFVRLRELRRATEYQVNGTMTDSGWPSLRTNIGLMTENSGLMDRNWDTYSPSCTTGRIGQDGDQTEC